MKRKHQRLVFVLFSMALVGLAATLVLNSFRDNLIFFYTPTQWHEQSASIDRTRELRIGGLVEAGSIDHTAPDTVKFTITDLTHTLPVTYTGMLPTLFREGQGVVAQGRVEKGQLVASSILAKHDENYMPKEVAEALKRSGRWQEGQ